MGYNLRMNKLHYYAQYNLGKGIPQKFDEFMANWCRLLAEQGDARAQNNLGIAYAEGNGVTQDYDEAVKWWRTAAEQGDAYAQYNLGVSYHKATPKR